jgi:uncharacterized caspase-like protein
MSIKPKLYALVAGVSDYADDSLDLNYAAKDAKDFGAALERQSGGHLPGGGCQNPGESHQ